MMYEFEVSSNSIVLRGLMPAFRAGAAHGAASARAPAPISVKVVRRLMPGLRIGMMRSVKRRSVYVSCRAYHHQLSFPVAWGPIFRGGRRDCRTFAWFFVRHGCRKF